MRKTSSSITISIILGLGLGALAACGGDDGGSDHSGVDGSKTVISMSASEKQTFCEWVVERQGGAGHTTECGDGVTVTTQTVAECVAGFADLTSNCPLTVSQAETCNLAIAADACSFGGEACAPVFECIPQ
jgi:hypothetical protein